MEDERCTLQVFSLRSMASGAALHRAYRRATQRAFQEAHELAFHYFGGVFCRVRYDKLKSAVKKILQGYQRKGTSRFIAFLSHWGFQAEFCTPRRGNEKGGVEGEVGYFRRNHWTPVPKGRSLAELNQFLEAACRQDESRHLPGREQNVGAAMTLERVSPHLQCVARQFMIGIMICPQKSELPWPQPCPVPTYPRNWRNPWTFYSDTAFCFFPLLECRSFSSPGSWTASASVKSAASSASP